MALRHIERRVNHLGDRLDLGAQLALDAVQAEAVLVRDEVDGDAEVAEPPRPADPVQVRLGHAREVEVDDHVDGLDVDAACEQVCRVRKGTSDEVAMKKWWEVYLHCYMSI